MNLRERLLAKSSELKIEPIEVFGEKLFVKELTGAERDAFESSLSKIVGKTVIANLSNVRAKLVIKSLCDESGVRIFEDTDLDSVGNLPAADLDKVFAVAQRLSGLKQEDIEELTKNL